MLWIQSGFKEDEGGQKCWEGVEVLVEGIEVLHGDRSAGGRGASAKRCRSA